MTSGDLLADRRLDMARALHGRGDHAAAAEVMEQALELAPDWVEGMFLLASWYQDLGQRDTAVTLYGRCLSLDPADRVGAVLRLALLGAVAAPPALPEAYVSGVFDDYADRFDAVLVERLDYQVPAALHALVTSWSGADAVHARVLDLGCGTGLAGERFRATASWLEGVDLSEGMIAMARRKALYDRLEVAEAVGFVARGTARYYDLVLAADVLVYLGDLAPLAHEVARVLVPGGRFAFSVEAVKGDGYRLTAGHRYAHGAGYLQHVLAGAGLVLDELRPAICRQEAGRPVAGYLVAARRPEATGLSVVPAEDDAGRASDRGGLPVH